MKKLSYKIRHSASLLSMAKEAFLLLNGFGQIMLQKSVISGALFVIGIGINSGWMAIGGIIGALFGSITAKVFAFNLEDISQGLYGFNGALAGVALLFFYEPSFSCFALIILGALLSSLLMRAMLKFANHIPPFTAPFILSTWAMLIIANFAGIERVVSGEISSTGGDMAAILRGISQIIFQDSWITGALFIVGIALNSRHAAAWALIGSAVGMVAARSLGYSSGLTDAGIFGFNAALTAIALGTIFRDNAMLTLLGILLSTAITQWLQTFWLPALTAPFVLSSWVVILAVRCYEKFGIKRV